MFPLHTCSLDFLLWLPAHSKHKWTLAVRFRMGREGEGRGGVVDAERTCKHEFARDSIGFL